MLLKIIVVQTIYLAQIVEVGSPWGQENQQLREIYYSISITRDINLVCY
jgi:hypothetical protein